MIVFETDHGVRKLWETPRPLLEDELESLQVCTWMPSDEKFRLWTGIEKELRRRDRIWKAYRLAVHVQTNIDVVHKSGDHEHSL